MLDIEKIYDVKLALNKLKDGQFTATDFSDELIKRYEFMNKTAEEIKMQYAKMVENHASIASDYANQLRNGEKELQQCIHNAEDIHSKMYRDVVRKMYDKKPVKYYDIIISNQLMTAIDNYNASIDKKTKLQKKLDKAERDLLKIVNEYKNIIPLLMQAHEIFIRYRNFRVYSRSLFYSYTIDTADAYIPMVTIKQSSSLPNVNWYFIKLSIDKNVNSPNGPTKIGIEIFKYDQSKKIPAKCNLTPYEINNRLKKVNPFPGDRFIAVKKIIPDVLSVNKYIISVLRMLVRIGFEF